MAGGLVIVIILLVLVAARHAWLPLWPGRVELALTMESPDAERARYRSSLGDRVEETSEAKQELVARNRPWSLVVIELDSGEQLTAYLVAAADKQDEDSALYPLPDAWRSRRVEQPGSLPRYALLKLDDGSQWRNSLDSAHRLFYPNRLDASERMLILLARVQERWAVGFPHSSAGLSEAGAQTEQ